MPGDIRREVERVLRAPVARAERAYGGYAPSATFRMRLRDGRRAFFKGSYPLPATSRVQFKTRREERVYRDLRPVIGRWSPRFLGSFERAGWHVILLEDVGPATLPPWNASRARRAAHEYARFHQASLGRRLPRWLTREQYLEHTSFWSRLARTGEIRQTASLARERRAAAASWLADALPTLRRAEAALERVRAPYVLLHLDTRSDNVRLIGERFVMFDWPFASIGPAEFDVAAFAQAVAAEGGPGPERFVGWYEEVLPLRAAALDVSIAGVAGYFADRAWRPAIRGLPRLRAIQRRQLKVSLPWAARRLGLPDPGWIDAVPD